MPKVRAGHTATLLSDGRVLMVGGGTDTTMLASAELYDPATGKFSPTGSMALPRIGQTATLLRDGRVLVAGGQDNDTAPLTYLALAELYDPATGKFSQIGSMALPRYGATATLLLDGRVLIAGSLLFKAKLPLQGNLQGYSAELYDPATGKFTMTGSMSVDRENHTATLLPDGRVLVTGGETVRTKNLIVVGVHASGILASADVYDPATGKFSSTGSMTEARQSQTATRLSDGRVLIAGGDDSSRNSLASAELYDPKTGKFSPTGAIARARDSHAASLLSDGLVLIAGGCLWGPNGCDNTASAELYDPATGKFSPTGAMAGTRIFHTATVLSNGLVLITGGAGASDTLASAELYDSKNGKFSPTGSMTTARSSHTATLLLKGRVLITGGFDNQHPELMYDSAELYDPANGTFSSAGSMTHGRGGHTATLLSDGRVLIAGGLDVNGAGAGAGLNSAELYQP